MLVEKLERLGGGGRGGCGRKKGDGSIQATAIQGTEDALWRSIPMGH